MPPSTRGSDTQPDLFGAAGVAPAEPAFAAPDARPRLAPETLDDAALIAFLPQAAQADCHAAAAEAGRRKLIAAVPALEALCRRFMGFGLDHVVLEQVAALQGLAAIGGSDARAAVTRLIVGLAVRGPGLKEATGAAAILGCRLPPDCAAALLRHADPDIRADACRTARASPAVIVVLVDLLDDLHPQVAEAAACALGRMGRPEARPALVRLIQTGPTPEAIAAIAPVADTTCIVLLGRIARGRPDLAAAALEALEDIDAPQAVALVASLRDGAGRVEADGRPAGR